MDQQSKAQILALGSLSFLLINLSYTEVAKAAPKNVTSGSAGGCCRIDNGYSTNSVPRAGTPGTISYYYPRSNSCEEMGGRYTQSDKCSSGYLLSIAGFINNNTDKKTGTNIDGQIELPSTFTIKAGTSSSFPSSLIVQQYYQVTGTTWTIRPD